MTGGEQTLRKENISGRFRRNGVKAGVREREGTERQTGRIDSPGVSAGHDDPPLVRKGVLGLRASEEDVCSLVVKGPGRSGGVVDVPLSVDVVELRGPWVREEMREVRVSIWSMRRARRGWVKRKEGRRTDVAASGGRLVGPDDCGSGVRRGEGRTMSE
jgi:hypothetical protein